MAQSAAALAQVILEKARLVRAKRRRASRAYWRAFVRILFKPFCSASATFSTLAFFFALVAMNEIMEPRIAGEEAGIQFSYLLGSLLAIPAWFCVAMAVAVLVFKKEDEAIGTWHGHEYVYRERQLLKTLRVTAEDNGRYFEFVVPDVAPYAAISYSNDTDARPGQASATLVPSRFLPDPSSTFHTLKALSQGETYTSGYTAVSKEKTICLVPVVLPAAGPVVIRVYIDKWCPGHE